MSERESTASCASLRDERLCQCVGIAERAAVKEQARTRGIGAAQGLLGGLVAAAAERMRRQHDQAEQRAARKEEQIEAEMQALSAPPQACPERSRRERKAAAQAYLAQKAWASFRAQERESVTLPPKEQPKPSDRPAVERPPIEGIIVTGILLTLATVVLEIPLIWGEAILAGPAFAGNPLAVGGELLLMSASAFLLNFEVAYWAYAYRVVSAPTGEDIRLDMTPFDWGLRK